MPLGPGHLVQLLRAHNPDLQRQTEFANQPQDLGSALLICRVRQLSRFLEKVL